MHQLAQSVFRYIRKGDLLRAGDRVGVAVSGGADSVALLRLLLEIQHEAGIVISVVHLNHQLRGAESDADEQFVRDLASAHGLEFSGESRDAKAYATQKKLSLEAAARELRYEFFEELLNQGKLNRVATAHTVDDQAETVMLRLLRGSGIRGLAGIRPRLKVKVKNAAEEICGEVVRPLLNARRAAVRVYLAEIAQKWREDATNEDARFTRNRIRQLVMPVLEREFNPVIAEKLAELAEIAHGEEEFWIREQNRLHGQMAKITIPEWARSCTTPLEPVVPEKMKQPGREPVNLSINLEQFRDFPLGVRRRLIQGLEGYGMPMEFKHIEEVIALASASDGDAGKEIQLPWGWKVVRTNDELQFLTPDLRVEYLRVPDLRIEDRIPAEHQYQCQYQYDLAVPGTVSAWEAGIGIEAVIASPTSAGYNPEHLLDRKFVATGLKVRNWRAGERFWPPHNKQPKKIKELLQDRHITGDQKKRWPVVSSGDEVVWVRGLGVGKEFQQRTGAGILIREVKLNSAF